MFGVCVKYYFDISKIDIVKISTKFIYSRVTHDLSQPDVCSVK